MSTYIVELLLFSFLTFSCLSHYLMYIEKISLTSETILYERCINDVFAVDSTSTTLNKFSKQLKFARSKQPIHHGRTWCQLFFSLPDYKNAHQKRVKRIQLVHEVVSKEYSDPFGKCLPDLHKSQRCSEYHTNSTFVIIERWRSRKGSQRKQLQQDLLYNMNPSSASDEKLMLLPFVDDAHRERFRDLLWGHPNRIKWSFLPFKF